MSTNIAAATSAPSEAVALILFAESPVHAGSGAVKAAVDLPVQRSVQTEWPILNDGTVRGGLRRLAVALGGEQSAKEWFGIEDSQETNPHPGRFATPDAELLLFPVASAKGMTAWVTCPSALRYFHRKLNIFASRLSDDARKALDELAKLLPADMNGQEAKVSKDSALVWFSNGRRRIVLESDSYPVSDEDIDNLAEWLAKHAVPFSDYWTDRMKRHFALLDDESFKHYVLTKTDIRTRIRVEEGRVAQGALWTEENLPMDTVLCTVLWASPKFGPQLHAFCEKIGLDSKPVIQLGGDQNLGRGLLRVCRLGA